MARGSTSVILLLAPIVLGLLAISTLPTTITVPNATKIMNGEENVPNPALTALPTTMNQNLSLQYQTILTKFISGDCPTLVNAQQIVTTLQNITAIGSGELQVDVAMNNNNSNSRIANKMFGFIIKNDSYRPTNITGDFPSALDGEWEHNYPDNNESRLINHQEVAYLLYQYNPKIVTITKNGTQTVTIGNISATANVYNAKYVIDDYREG
jgi:hypothetical protein